MGTKKKVIQIRSCNVSILRTNCAEFHDSSDSTYNGQKYHRENKE